MQYLTHDLPTHRDVPTHPRLSFVLTLVSGIVFEGWSQWFENSLLARLIYFSCQNPTNALPHERMRLEFFQGLATDARVRVHLSLVFSTSTGR